MQAKKPKAARYRAEFGTRPASAAASGPSRAAGANNGTNMDPLANTDQFKWRWRKRGRTV